MTTRLGPFNCRVQGSSNPFLRDAKVIVRPAATTDRATFGPPRNPLLAQLDGSIGYEDMLQWATIRAAHPDGLPAIVVVYLGFVYFHSTRSEATWHGAYAKKFIKQLAPAMKELFPTFHTVVLQRASEEPQPWSLTNGKGDFYAPKRVSQLLANVAGHKRAVRMPDDGSGVVTFAELLESATPLFRQYLQGLVRDCGFAEALGMPPFRPSSLGSPTRR